MPFRSIHNITEIIKIINIIFSLAEVENNSSLSLQILLFFNVYLAPIWTIFSIYYMYISYKQHEVNYEIILSLIFLIIAIPLEFGRIYLGYSGNLRERVSK